MHVSWPKPEAPTGSGWSGTYTITGDGTVGASTLVLDTNAHLMWEDNGDLVRFGLASSLTPTCGLTLRLFESLSALEGPSPIPTSNLYEDGWLAGCGDISSLPIAFEDL